MKDTTSCKIQKRGRKSVKPEKKLKCFAFRGGKGCKQNAVIATGLCGCKPCIIIPSQEQGYEQFVSFLGENNHTAAAHWRTEMHVRFKADSLAENEKLI
jgi:hypothetical protein